MPRKPLAPAALWLPLALCSCGPSEPPPHTPPPAASSAASPAPLPPPPSASSSAGGLASASAEPPRPPVPGPAADARPPADRGREACQKGDQAGCDILAEYWGGREILPQGKDAEARGDGEVLKHACDDKQVSSACMGYALMLKYGTATGKRDNESAKPYWDKVKKLGDLNGFRDGGSEEGKAAFRRVLSECEAGRARSCNQAGWAAYNGVQRGKSIEDAFAAYAKACQLGSAQGCRWAGHYAHVYDEVKNLRESERLLTRSCEGGFPGGCEELGNFVKAERHDDKLALSLYEKACEGGARGGCGHAGEILLASRDKAERKKGAERLKGSCEAEDDEGCAAYGALLEKGGEGVKKDGAAAAQAYARSCQAKNEKSCEALSRLAGADKGEKCALGKGAKVDERSGRILKEACKKNQGAPWCRGVSSCAE